MATIRSENFDSLTPPGLPSGFVTSGTWASQATLAYSSPNGLRSSTTGSVVAFQYDTADADNGNTTVEVKVQYGTAENANVSGVFLRSAGSAPWSGATHYEFRFDRGGGGNEVLNLSRRVSGAGTTLASYSGAAWGTLFSNGAWYRVILSANGSATVVLECKLQRMSDNQWFNGTSWQVSETTCLTFSDSSGSRLSGSGKAGVMVSQPTTASNITYDDFLFTDTIIPATTIAVDDADLFWSPYNWKPNGSTDKSSSTPGAYCKFQFTGTLLRIKLNSPSFTGTSLRIRAIVDDKQVYNTAVANAVTTLTLASGLSDTTHTAIVFFDASDAVQDVWANSPPTMSLRTTGFELDVSKDVSAATLLPKRMLVYGDSLAYGVFVLRTATHVTGSAAIYSPWQSVANALDAEYGILGFGSQGYGKTGVGGATAVWDGSSTGTWDKYHAGSSRLNAGAFDPAPDYVFLYHGTADWTGSSTDAAIEAGIEGLLAAVRGAAPSAKIFVVVPPGKNKIVPIRDGFEDFNTSYTTKADNGQVVVLQGVGDPSTFLIDLGDELANGLDDNSIGETYPAIDGYHPDTAANGRIGAAIATGVQLALGSNGGGSSAYGFFG